MENHETDKLNYCPFCCRKDMAFKTDGVSAFIECEYCGATGKKYDIKVGGDGTSEAFEKYKQCLIDGWNSRPIEDDLEKEIDCVEKKYKKLKRRFDEIDGFSNEIIKLSGIADQADDYDIEDFGVSAGDVRDAFYQSFLQQEIDRESKLGELGKKESLIRNMLKESSKYGLQVQVIIELFESKENGKTLEDCVKEAMKKWGVSQ